MDVESLKNLPSVDRLIQSERFKGWEERIIHPVRVRLAQELLQGLRQNIEERKTPPKREAIETLLEDEFKRVVSGGVRRVINATGVVLHTNLGRAPLSEAIADNVASILKGYCTLEFDIERGERGSRTSFIERLLFLLTGSPASVIVNNNAAALYLILKELSRGKEVVISRGELVQIGGGFRVPEILEASGACLREVGTTNMTSLQDYERAISSETALLLKVHHSNFALLGHTEEVSLSALVSLGKQHDLPVVLDLGSGLMGLSKEEWPFKELTVTEALRGGVSLVCFSGDKLLGGPQAGIILGGKNAISSLRRSPLYRALRIGKAEICLLEQVLLSHVAGQKTEVQERIDLGRETLRMRCESIAKVLADLKVSVEIADGVSSVGGGAMPQVEIPTWLLRLPVADTERMALELRLGEPPVIPRIHEGCLWIDLRTVDEKEDALLVKRLSACLC